MYIKEIKMYGIEDFNLEDFNLIPIMEIVDENKYVQTMDIEVDDKHHFFVRNPEYSDECIVSHNTAEIVFGDPTSDEYLDLKNYKVNPQREEFGWTSNNSIFAELGMDYTEACERVVKNGEPGFAWLENMQDYSRMRNGKDYKDRRVKGGNPCVVGDTVITTDVGQLRIDEIVDRVFKGETIKALSFNEHTLKHEFNIISKAWMSKKDATVLTLEIDENGQTFELTCTPDHKIYTTNRGYVEAKNLTEEDDIKIIT